MIPREEITGVILCGGAGSRLGQGEKSLALLDERPLVAHVRARFAPQVGTLLISANAAQQAYASWGDRVLGDETPALGPLGGLSTAFAECRTPYLACCPGDAPFVPANLVASLAPALDDPAVDLAVAHDGASLQQLFLLTRSGLSASLTRYLTAGGRSVRGWLETLRFAVVEMAADRAGFLNVNTPEELELARDRFAAMGATT